MRDRHTDGQTPRTSVTIEYISCIRCSLKLRDETEIDRAWRVRQSRLSKTPSFVSTTRSCVAYVSYAMYVYTLLKADVAKLQASKCGKSKADFRHKMVASEFVGNEEVANGLPKLKSIDYDPSTVKRGRVVDRQQQPTDGIQVRWFDSRTEADSDVLLFSLHA